MLFYCKKKIIINPKMIFNFFLKSQSDRSGRLYQSGLSFEGLARGSSSFPRKRESRNANRKISNQISIRVIFGILVSFFVAFPGYGESANRGGRDSGYKYVIRNYFSSRKPNVESHQGSPRHLGLYLGTSLYGETTDQDTFNPFSSFVFGLSQRISEYPAIGDLSIRVELLSMKFADKKREWLVDVVPVFSLPDVRSGFPVYVGAGGGLGLFPRHIVRKEPVLSFNARLFAGVRVLDWYENMGFFGEVSVKTQFPVYDAKLYMEVLLTFGSLFSF